MIVLDTNVLSEAMRPTPATQVQAWLAAQPPGHLYVTAIAEAELLYGAALLPAGRRRQGLEQAIQRMFAEDFSGRVLAFDRPAAPHYAAIVARRRALGRPIATFDAEIAAIARAIGFAVATRNIADFADLGVELIDPWVYRP